MKARLEREEKARANADMELRKLQETARRERAELDKTSDLLREIHSKAEEKERARESISSELARLKAEREEAEETWRAVAGKGEVPPRARAMV